MNEGDTLEIHLKIIACIEDRITIGKILKCGAPHLRINALSI